MNVKRLRELLNYDPLTGIFRWKVTRGSRAMAGNVAGSIDKHGYRVIGIDGRQYKACCFAWLYVHGDWPVGEIDHKNTIPLDDRIGNLRDVTHAGNMQNQRLAQHRNKTGMLGVTAHRGKFQAQIGFNGKTHYLGFFATPEAAYAAYLEAKRRLHTTCTL